MDTSEIDEQNITQTKKTPQERKLCYRRLLNKVEEIHESHELGLQTIKDVGDILREANDLQDESDIDERVEYADETLLDSMVLSSVSSVLVKCIEAVDVYVSTYDPTDFAKKIIKNSETDEDGDYECANLLKFVDIAKKIIPEVPNYSFVYGAYDFNQTPEPKKKKERIKRQKEQFERKEPEKVTNVPKEEQGIEEIVKTLYDVLMEEYVNNDEEPIKYYDYVIDTDNFGKTIENMFYCSFLIRDGKAKITLDGKGTPFIIPLRKKNLKAFRDKGGSNSQMISSISIAEWKRFRNEGLLQKARKAN